MVGQTLKMAGGLFSGRQDLPEQEYKVLDIRWGMSRLMNFKEMRETGKSSYEHPTFELLIKNDSMKRSRWTRGFPIREINLADQENEQQ